VCVCVCLRECVRACVRVCVCVHARMQLFMCVQGCDGQLQACSCTKRRTRACCTCPICGRLEQAGVPAVLDGEAMQRRAGSLNPKRGALHLIIRDNTTSWAACSTQGLAALLLAHLSLAQAFGKLSGSLSTKPPPTPPLAHGPHDMASFLNLWAPALTYGAFDLWRLWPSALWS